MTLNIFTWFRPFKSDLKTIKTLKALNSCDSAISDVLGVTKETLDKWKKNNKEVREILGESKEVFNIYHPEVKDKIELAFTSGGRKFYQFKDDKDIPIGRYRFIYHILHRESLAVDPEILTRYVDQLKVLLNGGTKGQTINWGETWKLVHNLDSRIKLMFEPFQFMKLSSVLFFDESEDLSRYDKEYSEKKITFWEETGADAFFFTKPMKELIGMKDISEESLQDYLKEAREIVKNIDSILDTSQ